MFLDFMGSPVVENMHLLGIYGADSSTTWKWERGANCTLAIPPRFKLRREDQDLEE